mmetsp:Transcript_32473/g.43192  ORF Transcript_32473/g.43192 Transcript_32473/m.43192 type:complete len:235 (+) Transcript_32473:85-789(+)
MNYYGHHYISLSLSLLKKLSMNLTNFLIISFYASHLFLLKSQNGRVRVMKNGASSSPSYYCYLCPFFFSSFLHNHHLSVDLFSFFCRIRRRRRHGYHCSDGALYDLTFSRPFSSYVLRFVSFFHSFLYVSTPALPFFFALLPSAPPYSLSGRHCHHLYRRRHHVVAVIVIAVVEEQTDPDQRLYRNPPQFPFLHMHDQEQLYFFSLGGQHLFLLLLLFREGVSEDDIFRHDQHG